MDTHLYSVRMRGSRQGSHITGAERVVPEASVSEVTAALMARAMAATGGPADEVHCNVERVEATTVHYAQLPVVSTCQVSDWQEGRQAAVCLLVRAGIQVEVASQAVQLLADGAGPGGTVMRGALLMDAKTAERLEDDPFRGVRVSRMDLAPEFRSALEQQLMSHGLGHSRVLEALVLAGKVLSAPGVIAELCWSDDPDYTTGYVADRQHGYQRISELKSIGDHRGGRVFFIDRAMVSKEEMIDYLERQVVLFDRCGAITAPEKWVP